MSSANTNRNYVSPEDIADLAGITVGERPLDRGFDGAYLQAKTERGRTAKMIIMNANMTKSDKRFIMARLVAYAANFAAAWVPHVCSCGLSADDDAQRAQQEKERAYERIALEVLMPADLLLRSIFTAGKVDQAALACEYKVSTADVQTRLQDLGLL